MTTNFSVYSRYSFTEILNQKKPTLSPHESRKKKDGRTMGCKKKILLLQKKRLKPSKDHYGNLFATTKQSQRSEGEGGTQRTAK